METLSDRLEHGSQVKYNVVFHHKQKPSTDPLAVISHQWLWDQKTLRPKASKLSSTGASSSSHPITPVECHDESMWWTGDLSTPPLSAFNNTHQFGNDTSCPFFSVLILRFSLLPPLLPPSTFLEDYLIFVRVSWHIVACLNQASFQFNNWHIFLPHTYVHNFSKAFIFRYLNSPFCLCCKSSTLTPIYKNEYHKWFV